MAKLSLCWWVTSPLRRIGLAGSLQKANLGRAGDPSVLHGFFQTGRLGERPGLLQIAPAQSNSEFIRVINIAHNIGFICCAAGLASRGMIIEAFFPFSIILDS